MPNIADAQNSYLHGKSTFEEWKAQFLLNWSLPIIEMQIAMTIDALKKLPPEIAGPLQQADPQAWAAMVGPKE